MDDTGCDPFRGLPRAENFPSNLETAEALAPQVGVRPERLLEWVEKRICPHWRIDGGEPKFRLPDVKRWMVKVRVLEECPGTIEATSFDLKVIAHKPELQEVPVELRALGQVFDLEDYIAPSGVYFLYLEGVLQYIGQSVNPSVRLSEHRRYKMFDRAFFIPVPAFMLLEVETKLVKQFHPPLNGNGNGTK